ncbi:hypothetical protein U1Q18_040004 [Sarracenia purpurea var. burkii]
MPCEVDLWNYGISSSGFRSHDADGVAVVRRAVGSETRVGGYGGCEWSFWVVTRLWVGCLRSGDRRLAVRLDVMAPPPSSRKSRGLIIPCASHLLRLQLRHWPPSLFLSPRDGAGDIGFWPLVCRYLVSDPPTSMSSLPLGSFAISDPGKVDLCFNPNLSSLTVFLGSWIC